MYFWTDRQTEEQKKRAVLFNSFVAHQQSVHYSYKKYMASIQTPRSCSFLTFMVLFSAQYTISSSSHNYPECFVCPVTSVRPSTAQLLTQ